LWQTQRLATLYERGNRAGRLICVRGDELPWRAALRFEVFR
jgi:hypothetical protein